MNKTRSTECSCQSVSSDTSIATLSPLATAALMLLDPVPHFLLLSDTDSSSEDPSDVASEARKVGVDVVSDSELLEQRHSAEAPIVLSDGGAHLAKESKRFDNVYALKDGRCVELASLLRNEQQVLTESTGEKAGQISKHAVHVLLSDQVLRAKLSVYDVRREDERNMYGYIEGTEHIACEDVPKRVHDFPEASALHCRTARRSAWASLVLREKASKRALVMPEGVYRWRFSESVHVYPAYEIFDEAPAREEVELEEPDDKRGKEEVEEVLQSLASLRSHDVG